MCRPDRQLIHAVGPARVLVCAALFPLVSSGMEAVVSARSDVQSRAGPATRPSIEAAAKAVASGRGPGRITVKYPLRGAIFPPEIPAPTFAWEDAGTGADAWLIEVDIADGKGHVHALTTGHRSATEQTPAAQAGASKTVARQIRWMPPDDLWAAIKKGSQAVPARVAVHGIGYGRPESPLSYGSVDFSTSRDAVGAPIFYRDVPLPFIHAFRNLRSIRWQLGDVSEKAPRTLLTGLKVCANCHSFTPDGHTLAMDVDYGNDKGSYVMTDVAVETSLEKEDVITWSEYRREDGDLTFGLLSQISPDGRYAGGTVKDRSVFSPVEDLYYSQRFFPIQGLLCVYDRKSRQFSALPGACDPAYVQSNPTWSPDGTSIVFARAAAYELGSLEDPSAVLIKPAEAAEFFEGNKKFRYDLYRVPFNGGKGGTAERLRGASKNGKSNYFAKFSPDGRWIVFCQSDSFMLLRPDSLLHIMPSEGGNPRRMHCNLPGKMNSWHSFSPNGRWLVFSSKANGPYTQLWLTHVDADGNDAPPVLLERFTSSDRAANIPEFVNVTPDRFAEIHPNFEDYYTHYRAGLTFEGDHDYARAVPEFLLALQEETNHVESIFLLASCLARMKRKEEALPYARQVAKLRPKNAAARGLLGGILSDTGSPGEALGQLEVAYSLNQRDISISANLAWVLATAPQSALRDGRRAVRLAEWASRAVRHTSPPLLDTLAAAYAEAGRFDDAVRATERAIGILRRNPGLSTAELEIRLALYRSRKPYRAASR